MAVYDGFFDAVLDEETGEYDRDYGPSDFTDYFANVIGTGVCVHNNPGSYKAEFEGDTLYLRPGYLFIQGYWLANKPGPDEDPATYKGYAVALPAGQTGPLAVVAHLNLGKRMIELEARSVAQAYPDSLVLAIVSPTAAEDTRHNTDICGVIDTAGELSSKVEWAINYIDTEIESKLAQVERDIAAQEAKLDAKIAEVQAVANSIVPPPVGSIKFSAAQDVDEDWLLCDGSFINEADYPELVAALGKLTPSGDKFQLISSGEIGPQISNGVVYGGRMWVYSYSAQKLYGVDLEGTAAVKEIELISEDANFKNFIAPTNASPLALSIVPHTSETGAKLFLAQIIADGFVSSASGTPMYEKSLNYFLVFHAEFSDAAPTLLLTPAYDELNTLSNNVYFNPALAVPTVVSNVVAGEENYYCAIGASTHSSGGKRGYLRWKSSGEAVFETVDTMYGDRSVFNAQRASFSRKTKNQLVSVDQSSKYISGAGYSFSYEIRSGPYDIFHADGDKNITGRQQPIPLTIAGQDKVLVSFDKNLFPWLSITQSEGDSTVPSLSLPSAARIFVDGGAYLWGKDIYMIFVGTGIIFSRTLESGSFGYLDTTSVLGTITQFGYLDYSQDEGTLYLLGQDTTNTVKAAKIVLNTLYDYANDGAWLPMIAADGVPAYIKAKNGGGGSGGVITDPVSMKITVSIDNYSNFAQSADIIFNGGVLIVGTFTRTVSASGTFTVGIRVKKPTSGTTWRLSMNGTDVVSVSTVADVGTESTATFNTADFIANGIMLSGR